MSRRDETLELEGLSFVWSPEKAKANRRKHGVGSHPRS
jgi:hypothetical protein